MPEKRDLVIIGAGPGGYVAAIRASQLGAKVTLIEKDAIGGTCLNWGCIPTKSILASTNLFSKIQKAGDFGIEVSSSSLNWPKVIARKDLIVKRLIKGIEFLLKKNQIEVIKGEASVLPEKIVKIQTDTGFLTLAPCYLLLATGSSPAPISGYKIDHQKVIDSTDALSLKELPKSITIIGGGVMGVEFATIFSEAKVKVTIVEALDRLLPKEDIEISAAITQIMKQKSINIKTNSKEIIDDEKILITIGRKLNTQGFAEAGIKLENGRVVTDENMQTNLSGVYAIGDIASPFQLAHAAMHQGKIAASHACKQPSYPATLKPSYPYAIFTHPEIARIGLTEEEAQQTGNIKAEKFPFMALGKAVADGERDGFIKIITNEEDHIIGTHIIGSHASLLIQEIALAVQNQLKAHQVMETIHIHPTLSEGLEEAVASIYGRAIHI